MRQVEALAAQKAAGQAAPAVAPAAPAAVSEETLRLQLDVIQQQKELELLKQGK